MVRPSDEQWIEAEIPEAAPPYPDENPPLRALPLWIYLLWMVVGLMCLGSPLVSLVGTLLGGAILVPLLIASGLGLAGLALAITLVMMQQVRDSGD